MEPFIGQIIMFGGNFAPRGWALCNGQLMSIVQYQALFSILGTTYGGDGKSTFALPDLRGRVSMHAGNGPGLTPRRLGEKGGQETVTLTVNNLPSHNHALAVSGQNATTNTPKNTFLAATGDRTYGTSTDSQANPATVTNTGGSQPFGLVQPFLAVNYIIALEGVFPSRN
ncbi:MAG: phage tail protein [Myxococcales bacterium]|nr:phage tail protein [Myxococcales bacterium]